MLATVRISGRSRRYLTVMLMALILLPALAGAQALPTELLADAGHALDAEQWEQALGRYQAFITHYPDHEAVVMAHFGSAESLFQMQRYEEALVSYRLVIARYPDWSDVHSAYFRVGNCLFQLQRYQEAAAAFAELLRRLPDTELADRAAYWLGEAHYHGGAVSPAMAAYEQSLRLAPKGEYAAYALYSIATIQFDTDKQATIATLQRLLQEFPDSEPVPDALYSLGRAHEALQQFDQALARYQAVVDDYPASQSAPLALAGIGSVQFSRGNFDQAHDIYMQVAGSHAGTEIADKSRLRAADARFAAEMYAEAAQLYAAIAADDHNPHAATAMYWQALAHHAAGQTQSAVVVLESFLALDPRHPQAAEAHLRLAHLYHLADRDDDARQAYERAAELSDDPEVVLQAEYGVAWVDYHQNESPEALDTIRALLTANPRSEAAGRSALAASELCLTAGAYQAALELAQLVLHHHPHHPDRSTALMLSGRALRRLGESDKARETFHRLLADYPDGEHASAAFALLALVELDAGQLQDAAHRIEQFSLAGASPDQLTHLLCLLGDAHLDRRQWDDAVEAYRAAYGANATGEWAELALLGLGNAHLAAGNHHDAAEALRRFAADLPNSPRLAQARMQLGIALAAQKQYAQAAQQLEAAIEAEPQASWAPHALMHLAQCQWDAGRLPPAVDTYLHIAEQYPEHELAPEALFWAGELRYSQANFRAATELYQRLVENYPTSDLADGAHYKLAWALLKAGQADEALLHFQTAAETAKNPAVAFDARLQAGHILVQCGDAASAAKMLEPAAGMNDADQLPALLLVLGQAHLASGDPNRAVAVLQRLNREFAESPYALHGILVLARGHKQLQQYEQAEPLLERLAASEDALLAAQARFEAAELSRLQGDLATAAAIYAEVAEQGATQDLIASALYHAGLCYEGMGRTRQAEAAYERIIAEFPNQKQWVQRAQQRLAELKSGRGAG